MREARILEELLQKAGRAIDPAVAISFHRVFGGEGFDVHDASCQPADLPQAAAALVVRDVLQDGRTDDQVEGRSQCQARELPECAAANAARLSKSRHDVIARLDSDVP